jgi:hypothetical protein
VVPVARGRGLHNLCSAFDRLNSASGSILVFPEAREGETYLKRQHDVTCKKDTQPAHISMADMEELGDGAVAAAMGFASFGGGSRPAKKRRFHAGDNAVIAGQTPKVMDEYATGTNAIPVRAFGGPGGEQKGDKKMTELGRSNGHSAARLDMGRDPNEVVLGDNNDESNDNRELGQQTVVNKTTAHGTAGDEFDNEADSDAEPQYLDTSRPSTKLVDGSSSQYSLPSEGPESATSFGSDSYRGSFRGARGRGRGGHRGDFHGVAAPGQPWWTNYHDPSFNQNPWERLEQRLGLEARGAWVKRG